MSCAVALTLSDQVERTISIEYLPNQVASNLSAVL